MNKKYFKKGVKKWANFAIKDDLRKMTKLEREQYYYELAKLYVKIEDLCHDFRITWTCYEPG